MSLQFQFSSLEQDGEMILGEGFRFGSCLVCVAPSSRQVITAPRLILTHRASGLTRSLNVHTRVNLLEESQQSISNDEAANGLFSVLMDTDELLFPDLAERYVVNASIGSHVYVQRDGSVVHGIIIDRERNEGNFKYLISLSDGASYQGSPVFTGDDLIGVLVHSGPGVSTVFGLEPITTDASPRPLFNKQNRRSLEEAYQSLLPERRSYHEAMRDRLSRMQLFVDDNDFDTT